MWSAKYMKIEDRALHLIARNSDGAMKRMLFKPFESVSISYKEGGWLM